MNASINETGVTRNKKNRVLLMSLAACALSVLGILIKSYYADASVLPYDPSMLFLLSFISGSMLLASALTVLSVGGKRFLFTAVASLSALTVGAVHVLLGAPFAETLLSLTFVPSAVVLATCMKNGCEKTHTVVANAVILSLTGLFSLLLTLYETFGEISAKSVGVISKHLEDTFNAVYSTYGYEAAGLTSSQMAELFDLAVVMIPAALIALVLLLSYIEATITRLVVLDRGVCKDEIGHWPLKMSRLSSVVFLLCFVIVAFGLFRSSAVLYMTAASLLIILTPGFSLIGLRSAPSRFKRGGLFGMVFILFILIYGMKNPAILFLLVSVSGAFDNLFAPFRERFYGEKKEKNNKK